MENNIYDTYRPYVKIEHVTHNAFTCTFIDFESI